MNFISLFSGIGGFELGLERAGMKCIGQVEIDDYCNKILEKHWPHVKRIKDIYDVTKESFRECGTVDLICGGFPCQPFSLDGKRGGQKDNRYLWPEMYRVIKAYRPTWILGENVAGIIGVELDKVLSDLESIRYKVQCFIIPACAVDAFHRRDRVWILAYTGYNGWDGSKKPRSIGTRDGTPSRKIGTKQPERSSCLQGRNEILANTDGTGQERSCRDISSIGDSSRRINSCNSGEDVADTESEGKRTAEQPESGNGIKQSRKNVADSSEQGLERKISEKCSAKHCRWSVEPNVGRVAHGIPNRVDRLKALGNAVVPQIVEVIGRAIMMADNYYENQTR